MKVLVTGGAGFIGSHVVRALLARGHTVVVLDDFSTGHRVALPEDARLVVHEGDVADAAAVGAAMQGCDQVVHLAALVSVPLSLQQPEETRRRNVVGFGVVLEEARGLGVKGRIIYASSAAVYGDKSAGVVREEDARGAVLASPYAESKARNEEQARAYIEAGGRGAGLRFFNVYGPGQDPKSPYSGVLARVVECARKRETFTLLGDGEQTRDFVFVEDVAAAVVALLELPQAQVLPPVMNIGTGGAVSLNGMLAEVGKLEGCAIAVVRGQAREGDIRHSCADVALVKSVLPRWQARGLAEGLRAWLKA